MKPNLKLYGGVLVVCLIAFIAIAIISAQIFERIPKSEDEAAYLFQAKVFAQNRLTVPTPPNADAFWSPFVIDHQGRRFGKYPPGWPLLLSLGVRLNAPWLVNAVLAVLTLGLIVWLGRCFYGANTGIWAAALALVTPGFLFLSSSLLSHPASLFWSTLALLFTYYMVKSATSKPPTHHLLGTTFYALLSGAALGAAFITRPFAALGIGMAFGFFLLIFIIRAELPRTVLLWLSLGGLAVALFLPLYWSAISGDPTFNPYLLIWPYDRIGFGPEIGPYGYTLYNAIFINTRLKLVALATGLFGWPGWSNLLFLPLPFLTRQANRWDWLLLGAILGLVFIHIFYWAFGGVDGGFPRYYYAALPAFLLLTVRGIQIVLDFLNGWQITGLSRRNWLTYLLIICVMGLISYSLIWRLPPLLTAQKHKYNITAQPLRTVEKARIPAPALVIIKDVESWSDFAAPFAANSPTLDGPVVYAIDWGPRSTQQIQAHFKDHACWELVADMLKPCLPGS